MWAAAHNRITHVGTAQATNLNFIQWFRKMSQLTIDPNTGSGAGAMITGPSDDTMGRIASRISELRGELKQSCTERSAASDAKEPGFSKMAGNIKRMILNASATSGEAALDKPGTEFKELLSQKNAGGAINCLSHLLCGKYKEKTIIQKGTATSVWSRNLRCPAVHLPENFLFFQFGKPDPLNGADTKGALKLYLKAADGDGVTESDIRKLLEQKLMMPASVDEFIFMLHGFVACCAILFQATSYIYHQPYS